MSKKEAIKRKHNKRRFDRLNRKKRAAEREGQQLEINLLEELRLLAISLGYQKQEE